MATMTKEQWLEALEAGEQVAISSCDRTGDVFFMRGTVLRTTTKYVILAHVSNDQTQTDGRKFLRINGSEVGKTSSKICQIDAEVKRSWARGIMLNKIGRLLDEVRADRIDLRKLSDEKLGAFLLSLETLQVELAK